MKISNGGVHDRTNFLISTPKKQKKNYFIFSNELQICDTSRSAFVSSISGCTVQIFRYTLDGRNPNNRVHQREREKKEGKTRSPPSLSPHRHISPAAMASAAPRSRLTPPTPAMHPHRKRARSPPASGSLVRCSSSGNGAPRDHRRRWQSPAAGSPGRVYQRHRAQQYGVPSRRWVLAEEASTSDGGIMLDVSLVKFCCLCSPSVCANVWVKIALLLLFFSLC